MAIRNCSAWRWCMVFCASVLVFSNACEALQKSVSGKECKSNTDCVAIANTTCMRHPEDTKMRCLCGEKKSPQNGACHHSKQGLHHKCNVDEDCIRHAACKAPTNSSSVPRTCECKEDYDEEDHECSISGKECKSNTDCAGIANTTCMRHPEDTKMRCLCGEKKSPQNGACHHSKQGLHHKCNVDEDCIRHAACKAPTNSSNVARTCECKEDYDEEDHECSSSLPTRLPCSQAVFLLLFYPVLQLIQ